MAKKPKRQKAIKKLKLSALNLADLESRYRSDAKQHYSFDLLTPHHFPGWIADLKSGKKTL